MSDVPNNSTSATLLQRLARRITVRAGVVAVVAIMGVVGITVATLWTNDLYWQRRALRVFDKALLGLEQENGVAVESLVVLRFNDPASVAGIKEIRASSRAQRYHTFSSTMAGKGIVRIEALLETDSPLRPLFDGPLKLELEGVSNDIDDHLYVVARTLPKATAVDLTPALGQWLTFNHLSATQAHAMVVRWITQALRGDGDPRTRSVRGVRGEKLQGRPVIMITIEGAKSTRLSVWMEEEAARIVKSDYERVSQSMNVRWQAQWGAAGSPQEIQEPTQSLAGEQILGPFWQSIATPQGIIREPLVVPEALLEQDSDLDGLSDAREREIGTDPYSADTDGDGLTDGEETGQFRSNPLQVDTDGDGLVDAEEVRSWKTDPTNADTDGDRFKDGEEVRKGYNPAGPGRLRGR